jgi:hypothetical protein
MELTMFQVMDINKALDVEMKERLPFVLNFKLSILRDKLASYVKRFNETNYAIIKENGIQNPKLGPDYWEVDPAKMKEFMEAMKPLNEEKVTIDFEPIKKSMLEPVNFVGNSLHAFLPIITE